MDNLSLFYFLTIISLCLPITWILTDYRSIKGQIKWHLGLERVIRDLLTITLIITQFFLLKKFPYIILQGGITITIIGIILYFSGLFLTIRAKLTMGSLWGTPAQHDIKRQSTLITSGPFSISRNPIYVGDLLVYIGYFIALHSYLVFLSPIIFFLINIIIEKEEKILEKCFGKKYIKYKKNVPRYILLV